MREALAAVRRYDSALEEEIADLNVAISVRHRIIHGYDQVDHVILFETVRVSLPRLVSRIDAVLGDSRRRGRTVVPGHTSDRYDLMTHRRFGVDWPVVVLGESLNRHENIMSARLPAAWTAMARRHRSAFE